MSRYRNEWVRITYIFAIKLFEANCICHSTDSNVHLYILQIFLFERSTKKAKNGLRLDVISTLGVNPLTAGAVHTCFSHFLLAYYISAFQLLKIKRGIIQQDLKFVDLHLVKS